MPKTRTMSCAICQRPMWKSRTSLPQGEAMCRPCRRVRKTVPGHPCIDCGAPCTKTRCRPCNGAAHRVRAENDSHLTRDRRESAAPGLSYQRRARLLARWKRQLRACTYCDQPATTIDHVVPLVRGGTNYEGNLAPSCKSCNSRKGGRMLIEWRAGKRLSRMTIVPNWQPKPKRPKVQKARPDRTITCDWCGSTFTASRMGIKHCSEQCRGLAHVKDMRERYRLSVGIPLDSPLYTRAA